VNTANTRMRFASLTAGCTDVFTRFPLGVCILFVLLVTLIPACAWSQSELATVFGTVSDQSGAVIPKAQITIVNQSTGLTLSTVTDMTGQYHISGLPTGNYVVRAIREGFLTQVREGVTLTAASEVMIDFPLVVGSEPQQISVSGDVNQIDSTTSTVGSIVSDHNLSDLPLNGRDLFKAVVLEPGVAPTPSSAPSLLSSGNAGQVSIDGMRPSWTDVRIDGMDANDPVLGYSPAGASGLFLGLDEFTEVRVLTQTFDVEYGRNGGGVIDAVTKSGTNHFHGSLFELHRDDALDAKNYFDLANAPIPPFVRNQFGAGIGGPLLHDHTFFYANYEGFRQVQASTAIATVPDALAHQGLLPSATNPESCSNATPNGCVVVAIDPRVPQFLSLFPLPNGADNGDGTADLISDDKGNAYENHGMIRVDQNFSNAHSLFARYIIDDSSSLAPYYGRPPGTYVPGFPVDHTARNQYFTVQDRSNLGRNLFNELRFGGNRTTASSTDNTQPGLSISMVPDRPFGMLDITGMSLLGNSPSFPLGDFSTVYEVQDELSRTTGGRTVIFGGEFRRIESNGPEDFAVNGLYSFQDLSPFGIPAQTYNPALEFFLQALPLSYVGALPSMSDSNRDYRESVASGFVQDFWRVSGRLKLNGGLRYDFYSNPTETHGWMSAIRNPATDSGPTVGKLLASTPLDLFSPRAGFAWNIYGDGRTLLRGGAGIFRDRIPIFLFGIDRFLPPFFAIDSFVLPNFLNPQNALLTQPIYTFSLAYHAKFPYALQYNLNLEREIAPGTIFSAGYFGARGNHLFREVEANPFEAVLGHRYNPNLPSPLLEDLTDSQSFYNSFQVSLSQRHAHSLSWQAFYAFAHSIDDASTNLSIDAVNEPLTTQDPFNRKGDRGRSGFDIRQNLVTNIVYELPFARKSHLLGGWQISAIASVHSNVPFTPVLAFDNADVQSLVISERPDLTGNPYTGACPNGSRVGTPSCWFNPSAFVLPPPGQFGTAGRNSLCGPAFAEFDLSLNKGFQLTEGTRFTFGAEAYDLFNHPNFGVPSNTQSPLSSGGNGDAIFKDAAGDLADNVGRIFTTVGSSRQIQLEARVTF
jgi:hypothetical protein